MGKARSSESQAPEEIAELREEIASLKDHIRLLVDAIDEVREELSWLTRNGLPSREPLPPVPVLKQMAADPCADDWGERLVIDYGTRNTNGETQPIVTPETASVEAAPTPSEQNTPARPGHLF
ncbi:MAG: hypothetical protein R3C59_20855 [Planctomycetaceae bacterium]